MAKKEVKQSKDKTSFFKSFKAELKKVIWPTPKQLVNNTVAVVTIVLITVAIVFVLDLAFETINSQGINKIKEVISESNSVSENTTDEDSNSGETSSENSEASTESSEENNTETENTQTTETTQENTEQ